jgi:hypothetical protein
MPSRHYHNNSKIAVLLWVGTRLNGQKRTNEKFDSKATNGYKLRA